MPTTLDVDVLKPDTLPFNVDPNLITELGINLYTDLYRVLAEFIANAWDADADVAEVAVDFEGIRQARNQLAAKYAQEYREWKQEGRSGEPPEDLAFRTIDPSINIIVSDNGHGMDRASMRDRFLKVGRKRRKEDNSTTTRSGTRPLMGRKGIGKLSGFGVAKRIVVTSLIEGESEASQITLDFDEILKSTSMHDVQVPFQKVQPPDKLLEYGCGTIVELSSLVHDGTKNQYQTVKKKLTESFCVIGSSYEFVVSLNDDPLEPPPPQFRFSYPELDGKGSTDLAEETIHVISDESGHIYHLTGSVEEIEIDERHTRVESLDVRYRIWFEGKSLESSERGVRIYANGRLVNPASLFGLHTGTHGFVYHSYLTGVVHADFIDKQKADLVATDRQGLKWDNELLDAFQQWLTDRIVEAIKAMAADHEKKAESDVKRDPFTLELIDKHSLVGTQRSLAFALAKRVSMSLGDLKGEEYRNVTEAVVKGIGSGDLMTRLHNLSVMDKIDISSVTTELLKLASKEYDDFRTLVRGRLDGIEALKRMYEDVDFREANKEKEIQDLLSRCPWLIDPMYSKFVTSDEPEMELFRRLSQHLCIDEHATDDESERANKRPDLTFLMGDVSHREVIIVELKALNTPLLIDHWQQLQQYMDSVERFLQSQGHAETKVKGYLIGSRNPSPTASQKQLDLDFQIKKRSPEAPWQVWDVREMLHRTKVVHQEFIKAASEADKNK